MNLKLILPIKKVKINGKDISIPKLGIKHHLLVKDVENAIDILDTIVKDIKPGLTVAEYDLMIVHLLEFNNKLKSTVNYNGETLNINDIYISQKLDFSYKGKTFSFKEPNRLITGTADMVLNDCYLGNQGEIDFLEMPAFVYKWVESMTKTLSIKTKNGVISGANEIMEIFKDGEE